MRKALLSMLVFVFLFNVIGYYLLYHILESNNRNEMQKSLAEATVFETIRIHKSELHNVIFEDDGNEILLNGEMYDIRSKVDSGDYVIFYCIQDKHETKLRAEFSKHVNTDAPLNHSPYKKRSNFHKNPIKDLFYDHQTFFSIACVLELFRDVNIELQVVYLAPHPLPPPEIVAA